MRTLNAREIEKRGYNVSTAMPPDGMVPRIVRQGGEDVAVMVPKGIDPGFDYNVGRNRLTGIAPPPAPGDVPPGTGPEATRPMLAPRAFDRSRILPKGGGPEYYVRAFLEEFGTALDKPALFIDKVGEALPVGGDLFRRPDGSWKVLKSDRGRYVKLLAENVKNPDEIWFDWRRDPKTGKWNLRRRYLSRFDLDGGQESCLTVFEVARTGWRQVTNFAPRAGKGKDAQKAYLRKQRRGSMIWAREEK